MSADYELLEWVRTVTPEARNGALLRWPNDPELGEVIARRGALAVCRAFGEAWAAKDNALDALTNKAQVRARAMVSCCGADGDGWLPLPERMDAAAVAIGPEFGDASRLRARVRDIEAEGRPTCVAVVTAVAEALQRKWEAMKRYAAKPSFGLTPAERDDINADIAECERLMRRIDREKAMTTKEVA